MAASSPAAPASKRAPPMRGFAVICGVVALIVLLIGGYAGHWAWTGFSDNDTLWDWLQLLLLPIAIATLPIWVRHGRFLDPRVRIALGVGLLVFLAIVLLGYLMPWKWTGFTGNTLWDWLGLRPAAVRDRHDPLLVRAPPADHGPARRGGHGDRDRARRARRHRLRAAVELDRLHRQHAVGLDPARGRAAAVSAGDHARGPEPDRDGMEDRRAAEEGAEEGDAPPAAVAQAPAPAPAPAGRMGMAGIALAAAIALVVGGVAGALAFGGDSSSSTSTQASKPASAAATPCTAAKAQTVAADNELTVVQSGNTFYACGNGAAKPLSLGTAGAASPLSRWPAAVSPTPTARAPRATPTARR